MKILIARLFRRAADRLDPPVENGLNAYISTTLYYTQQGYGTGNPPPTLRWPIQ